MPAFFPWSLTSPFRPLLLYFKNTPVCLGFTEVAPYVCVCFARQCAWGLIVFCRVPFPLRVFNNIGSSERNRMPHGAVLLCLVGNPCWCLDRKCVLCPTRNAKGNLDRMECYTNTNLAKMVEIIQTPVRDRCLFYGLSTNRYLKQEECLLSLW